MLVLPEPFGPTIAVPPPSNRISVERADVLALCGALPDRGRFLDSSALSGGGLDLSRPQSLAGYFPRIVGTAEKLPLALAIAHRPITMHPDVIEAAPV